MGARQLVAILLFSSAASAQSLSTARSDAAQGKVDAAVQELQAGTKTAEAQSLLCSLYTSVEQRDPAISSCEAAAAAQPNNSTYALELARAYGAKAEHSGPLTGMRLVGKVRGNFERAVELDGKNVDALSDLGQFYVDAPGVAGGGIDKARALVLRLQALSPARAHRLAAMIAAKGKEDALAEQEFRAAIAASGSAESYYDLANFYRSRKNWQGAADNAQLALDRDTRHGPDTLDAAQLLLDIRRNTERAQTGLRSYLNTAQVHVASYAKAHVLLAKSLEATDRAAAQAQFQAALSLARDYEPARQGLRP